jgi:hypothetical protein
MATLEQRIYDADRAREVLENEAFKLAIERMKQEYTQAWMNSPASDPEGREELWKLLKLTDRVQMHLSEMLTDGKIARTELDYQAQQLARERAHGVLTG